MKALTLTQPWASLIAIGAKRIETRSWTTDFRGQVAIHAAKGLGPVGGKSGLKDRCRMPAFAIALEGIEQPLQLGAIVAVANLVNVRRIDMRVRAEVMSQIVTPYEIEFGDYASGRYAWILEDVKPLAQPVPCSGALSLWEVPDDVHRQVFMQIEGLTDEDLNESAEAMREQQHALNLR